MRARDLCRSFRNSLLLGAAALTLVSTPVLAQEAETKTYEGKEFPFSLTWNTEVWNGSSSSSFATNERLQIQSGATLFYLEAYSGEGNNAQSCVVNAVESIQDVEGIENIDENDDLPMPESAPVGSAEILLTYDVPLAGRDEPVAFVQYLACAPLGDDALLLIGIETRAGIYEEELEIIEAVLAGLEIDAA